MNPYLVLGVPPEADDLQVRQAYLEAIRVATPDTQPRRFQDLSEAYTSIKDEASRLRYLLFNRDVPGDSPLDAFIRCARWQAKPKPLPFESMKAFLRSCAKS